MEKNKDISAEVVAAKILMIRGKKVMLDRDLASLYGVETRVLNQAVKRNISRFPEDFMVLLSRQEIMRISQFVISLRFSKQVYVFTEQGVAMLSSVLNSERAIAVNIQIMRAFVMMRRVGLTYVGLKRKIEEMERKYDKQFLIVFEAIKKLLEPLPGPPSPSKPPIGFRKD
jgi:hypothetical protein